MLFHFHCKAFQNESDFPAICTVALRNSTRTKQAVDINHREGTESETESNC